jgi:2-octaprenyl-6-methoxyphenol hydroxylase
MTEHDVLIVGGGLVGATLAHALAIAGYQVALFEPHPFGVADQPSFDDRTVALSFGSRRILQGLGLWTAIAPAATPIKTIHVSERGRFGATRLLHDEEAVEALGFVVPNRAIGQVLYAQLAEHENVELTTSARLQDLAFDASYAMVTVALRDADDKTSIRALRCRLLVAADGANSEIRRRLNIGVITADYGQTAVVAIITPTRHHAYVAFERFTDSGPLALLPMDAGRCSLVWSQPPEEARATMCLRDADFLRKLQDHFGYRLGILREVGLRHAYPLSLSMARTSVAPRAVLVGNAAHSLHPVAGQGFNLALRDVAALAETLLVSGCRDPGDRNLLAQYASSRQDDLRHTVWLTDGLARVFTNPFKPVAWGRAAALPMLNALSPLRHMLARRAMGLGSAAPRLTSGLALTNVR